MKINVMCAGGKKDYLFIYYLKTTSKCDYFCLRSINVGNIEGKGNFDVDFIQINQNLTFPTLYLITNLFGNGILINNSN